MLLTINVSVDVAVMNVAENLQFVTKLGFQNMVKGSQTFTNIYSSILSSLQCTVTVQQCADSLGKYKLIHGIRVLKI